MREIAINELNKSKTVGYDLKAKEKKRIATSNNKPTMDTENEATWPESGRSSDTQDYKSKCKIYRGFPLVNTTIKIL